MKRMSVDAKKNLVSRVLSGEENRASVAREFGITRQRVHQIASAVGATPRAAAIEQKRLEVAGLLIENPDQCLAQLCKEQQIPPSIVSSARKIVGHESKKARVARRRSRIGLALTQGARQRGERRAVIEAFPGSQKMITAVAKELDIYPGRDGLLITRSQKEERDMKTRERERSLRKRRAAVRLAKRLRVRQELARRAALKATSRHELKVRARHELRNRQRQGVIKDMQLYPKISVAELMRHHDVAREFVRKIKHEMSKAT